MSMTLTTSALNHTSSSFSSSYSPYSTTAPFAPPYIVDYILAAICILCFIIGTSGNILAFIYFIHQRKDLPTKIYLQMTVTDAMSSCLVLVVSVSYINSRHPSWFALPWLCDAWSSIWNVTPYFSVFLVLVLSVVRTTCLMNPFRTINHKVVMVVIGSYLVYLFARSIIPRCLGLIHNKYKEDGTDVYCGMALSTPNKALSMYQIFSNVIQVTAPVLPILISCVLSCYCVLKSRKMAQRTRHVELKNVEEGCKPGDKTRLGWRTITSFKSKVRSKQRTRTSVQDKQLQATITILMITGIYILFNVPVFIFYCLFVVDVYIVKPHYFFVASNLVRYYGWNIVFVICVALNAAINPLIYAARITKMRQFYSPNNVKDWAKGSIKKIEVKAGFRPKSELDRKVSRSNINNNHSMTLYTELQTEML